MSSTPFYAINTSFRAAASRRSIMNWQQGSAKGECVGCGARELREGPWCIDACIHVVRSSSAVAFAQQSSLDA
jgi:hypothetical protein